MRSGLVIALAACWSDVTAAIATGPVVAPSGPEVPANLLRIEVSLEAPLPGDADPLSGLALTDATGRPIESAFLPQALVSADRRTVTLLLHPGRVKSGLVAYQSRGRVFRAGDVVTLFAPALEGARRQWRVAGDKTSGPRPARWRIGSVRAGTRQPLAIELDAPVDRAAGLTLVAIAGPAGDRLAGVIGLDAGERVWRFRPRQPWTSAEYVVRVHPNLEDAAGNTACAPFEHESVGFKPCSGQELRFKP